MGKRLKLQVVLEALDNVSAPFKSINARAARMAGLVKSNNTHLRTLERSLKGVQNQQQAMQAKGIRVSDNMVNAEQRLQNEIAETTAAIEKQKNALGKLNQTARNMRKLSERANSMINTGSSLTTKATLPISGGLTLAAREAILVEKAMASVAKFAPEFGGDQQKQAAFMEKVKKNAAELSMQTGRTQSDIAAMYEEMGAAGLAADKWDAYSQKFIKGAVALDMEVGELSQIALGIMASTGNKGNTDYLQALLEKANLASDMGKMRAANVLDVANRSLGLARNAGIADNAFIGLTGAALDAGGQDDVTGRAWKTILARLTSTAKLTKAQGAAWKALNIDPETFTKAFKDDPIGKLEQLTKAVNANADGMGELGIIVGTEFVDTVVKMGSNVETARKIQEGLSNEQLRATKLQGEYNRMAATTDTQLKRGLATLKVMGDTIGAHLLPRINALLDRVQPLIKKTSEWIEKNPELTDTIIALAAGLALLGPTLYMTGNAIKAFTLLNQVLPLLASLGAGVKILMGILVANPVTASLVAIAAGAMLLWQNWEKVVTWFDKNPFVKTVREMPLVRHAIDTVSSGIEVVAALLNGDWSAAWEGAKAMADSALKFMLTPVKTLWQWVKKLGDYVGVDIGAAFSGLLDIIQPAFAGVMSYFGVEVPDKLSEYFANIGASVKDAILNWNPTQWFSDIFSGAFSWVENKLQGMVQFFTDIKNKISNFFGESDAKMQALSEKQKKANDKLHGQKQRAIYDGIQQTVDKTRANRIANNLTPAQRQALEDLTPAQLQRLKPHQRDYLQQLKNTAKTPKITTAKKTLNQSFKQNVTVNQTINTTTAGVPKQVGAAAAAAVTGGAKQGGSALLMDTQ